MFAEPSVYRELNQRGKPQSPNWGELGNIQNQSNLQKRNRALQMLEDQSFPWASPLDTGPERVRSLDRANSVLNIFHECEITHDLEGIDFLFEILRDEIRMKLERGFNSIQLGDLRNAHYQVSPQAGKLLPSASNADNLEGLSLHTIHKPKAALTEKPSLTTLGDSIGRPAKSLEARRGEHDRDETVSERALVKSLNKSVWVIIATFSLCCLVVFLGRIILRSVKG